MSNKKYKAQCDELGIDHDELLKIPKKRRKNAIKLFKEYKNGLVTIPIKPKK